MQTIEHKLTLHCGASEVDRDSVTRVATPLGEGIHRPIPHIQLVDLVTDSLRSAGLVVTGEAHALSKNKQRYFGLLQVDLEQRDSTAIKDFSWVVGLRNAHDKTFPATVCAGSRVFVCDNLAFNGEIMLARRHTTNVLRDLPQLTNRAVGLLSAKWNDLETQVKAYKAHELDDRHAHDVVVKMLEAGVFGCTTLPKVLNEFREPRHEEFLKEGRTAWTMMNAVTEVMKGVDMGYAVKRTQAMHGVLDGEVGLLAQIGKQ
jgi:hypothetical protein